MDRKAGCVTVQPTVPETAVSTLDFVRAERDQLLVSGAFLMSSYRSPWTERSRPRLCLAPSLPGGFSGVSSLKGQLVCVVLLSDDTATAACVIWVSCKYLTELRGVGFGCVSAEVHLKKKNNSFCSRIRSPIKTLRKNFLLPVVVDSFSLFADEKRTASTCPIENWGRNIFLGKLCCMLKHTFHWNA